MQIFIYLDYPPMQHGNSHLVIHSLMSSDDKENITSHNFLPPASSLSVNSHRLGEKRHLKAWRPDFMNQDAMKTHEELPRRL